MARVLGRIVRLREMLRGAAYRRRWPRAEIGRGVVFEGRVIVRGPGRVVIGDRVRFATNGGVTNLLVTMSPDALIVIGAGSYVNGAQITAARSIEIGEDGVIGETKVFDTDFHGVEPSLRRDSPVPIPVRIGRNCWLADRSAVLKGVSIGDDSVVGFGTVVTSDVPAGVVVAGPESRLVRRFG